MRVGKADGREWLRLAEAAAVLGVSHNNLRRWSDDGRLPHDARRGRLRHLCGGQRRPHCLVGVDADGVDKDAARESLDVDAFLATTLALRSGELVTVRALDDPQLTERERRYTQEWGYRSEVCIPLVSRHAVIGLIDVLDTRPREYTAHRDYLQSLGRVATATVEKEIRA